MTITWSGYSPTLGAGSATVPALTGTLVDGKSPLEKQVALLTRRPQLRAIKSLLNGLIGAASGGTVTANKSQVKAKQGITNTAALGGLVEVESAPSLGTTTAGRATTAQDVTDLKAMVNNASSLNPSQYPADLSGNGGGGQINKGRV